MSYREDNARQRRGRLDAVSRIATRYHGPLTHDHLREIQDVALIELARTFHDYNGKYRPYQDRLLAICLCQGAAQHYVDGVSGVGDIDVWFFFRGFGTGKSPVRMNRNFITSSRHKFSQMGERDVDFCRTVIPMRYQEVDIAETIRLYLAECRNATPTLLAQKAVVGIYREHLFGRVIWPWNCR